MMVFGVIGLLAASLGLVLYVLQSQGAKPRFQVKVLEVVDAMSVNVQFKDETQIVRLGGVDYPEGDERAVIDGQKLIEDLAKGRTFEMEVLREREDEWFVNLRSVGGESLNELMLKLGFARYSAVGIGFIPALVGAEGQARSDRKGIWNSNRELFRSAANSFTEAESEVNQEQPVGS